MGGFTTKEYYGLTMAGFGIMCCLGHLMIALAHRTKPSMKERNFFLRSLGVSDMLVCVHTFLNAWAAFQNSWVFGDIGCQVDAYLGMAFTLASISNVVWIAKDKYYNVHNSREWNQNYNYHAMMLWISAMVVGGLPLLGFGSYGFETSDPFWQTGCLLDFHYVGFKYTFYIIAISIYWFAVPVYRVTWYYKKINDAGKANLPLEYIVPAQMITSLTPYAVYALLSVTIGAGAVPFYVTAINNVAAKIFIATNPFLYVWSDEELRETCIKLFTEKHEVKKSKKLN
ncbi:RPE-retinal G protein-coupled receptor-like [Clavelina lepadiformis]|uniref:RPE-retinal G protein-coupled receptor-like n=1 Tax=Clavelina lepadiformis TaxID=159417 RepID=UPI00404251AB